MSRSAERELFLKYIVDTYLKNPNLSISSDILYGELLRFSTCDGSCSSIDRDSLVGVQVRLNNKFKNNDKASTFTSRDGYFWAIENRCGKNDKEFYRDMYNSVKLYVSIDLDNIYKISELLFKFMIKEGIVMQCKISKNMRNDVLVCRVYGKEAVVKICDYLNNLNYESKFRPNPFLLDNGKVGVAIDGKLSYNGILAKLLLQYFNLKKKKKELEKVNCDDFNIFITSQIDMLNNEQKKNIMNIYGLIDEDRCKDFFIICNLISKNLNNTLSMDDLFKYSNVKDVTVNKNEKLYSKQDQDKILYVINGLSNYYSVEHVHKIIIKFIETGDYKLFTRRDDIRYVVSDNYTPIDIKNIISNLGYSTFISVSKFTCDKYGKEQLLEAIRNLFNQNLINGFTNEYDVRSRLGLIIPLELLKEVIVNKLNVNNKEINVDEILHLVLEQINDI